MPALDEIRDSKEWPPPGHGARIAEQGDYQKIYRNRRDEIVQAWSAELTRYIDDQEDLVTFPSAQLAVRTLAAFLFGEDPRLTVAGDKAQAALDTIAAKTNLPARLLEGALSCAAQGEIYLKVNWDDDLSPHPLITAVPGRRVIPSFRYGLLVDAAVITEYRPNRDGREVLRLVEFHEAGTQQNLLFRGTPDRLGTEIDLDDYKPTADLEPEIETDIDTALMFHVPFQRDTESAHGVSVLDGKEGLIFGLHRLYSQEQHDAEIARKRIAIPETYLRRNAAGKPVHDRRDDVFVLSEEAAGAVGAERPITPIEFQDSGVARERIAGRLREFLIACGIAPQTFGEDAGNATSGTARKLAQAMTLQTVGAAARYWTFELAACASAALQVAQRHLSADLGAGGDHEVSVEIADGLLEDPVELARIINELDAAGAISTEQKVERLHPDWSDPEKAEEVVRIRADRAAAAPPIPPLPALGTPPDDDEDTDEGDDDAEDTGGA